MSANIDTMMYVKSTPWHGLGTKYEAAPQTSAEIISGANLGWTVNTAEVKTDIHGVVPNYHVVYREDTNDVFGLVRSSRPEVVQNVDSFNAFDHLIQNKTLTVDTAASLGIGEKVFACFELSEGYKVFDDDIKHYFVVFNDHMKVDGKVTVLNTPVRVVCENTLSAALSNNVYKVRIPISTDKNINMNLASRIMESMKASEDYLASKCSKLYKQKIDRDYVDKMLDELFPIIQADGESGHDRANETAEMMRETFLTECMGADNLNNYRGTALQFFNAVTDWDQHYYKDGLKAYDLNAQMKKLPGIGDGAEPSRTAKFLKANAKLMTA